MVGVTDMNLLRLVSIAIALQLAFVAPASGQLRSRLEDAAQDLVVMVMESQGCAGGIIVGYDESRLYIATAAHVVDTSRMPLPTLQIRFSGTREAHPGTIHKVDVSSDLALVTVDRDPTLNAFLNRIDFAILSPD